MEQECTPMFRGQLIASFPDLDNRKVVAVLMEARKVPEFIESQSEPEVSKPIVA